MKRILCFIIIFGTAEISAEPYETAQRFEPGDVISADVINDILDRIELSLKEITVAELVGTYSATQHICNKIGGKKPGIAIDESDMFTGNGCLAITYPEVGGWDSVTNMEDGLYGLRTDTITITAISGSNTKFTLQSENFNFIHQLNRPATDNLVNQGVTHECSIIGSQGLIGCLADEAIVANANFPLQRSYFIYQMRRLSPTRFEMLAVYNGSETNFNLTLSNTHQLGNVLYTDYIHLFQISGIILLVAMVGAITLTFSKKENVKRQSYFKQIQREKETAVSLVEVERNKGVKIDE